MMWHVVKAPIPLLWGKGSMKKAKVLLDLPNNKVKILGEWVNLNLTSIGHYAQDILPKDQLSVEDCLIGLSEALTEKKSEERK